jgi:hypothetical protein
MHLAARCYLTAGAAVAAGTMIAIIPTSSSLPGLQVRPFQLTSDGTDILTSADDTLTSLINLQYQEMYLNTFLVMQEMTDNSDLLKEQLAILQYRNEIYSDLLTGINSIIKSQANSIGAEAVGGSDPSTLTGSVDHLVDANNLLFGTSQTLFDSQIGADNFSPAAIDSSLLIPGVGAGDVPFVTDGVGGVEGATGNTLTAYGDYISYLNTQFGLSLADFSSQDLMNLASADLAFNQALVADELAFNHNLLTEELAAESAAFGGNDSALNGVVDRVINIDNLYLATGESSVNDVLGANYSPAELTASVLTGDTGYTGTDPTIAFDTGELGGLQGIFDQNAALASDLAGLTPAEISSAFAPGAFDTAAFITAIGDLYNLNVFSNLAPDFATMSGDFGTT